MLALICAFCHAGTAATHGPLVQLAWREIVPLGDIIGESEYARVTATASALLTQAQVQAAKTQVPLAARAHCDAGTEAPASVAAATVYASPVVECDPRELERQRWKCAHLELQHRVHFRFVLLAFRALIHIISA